MRSTDGLSALFKNERELFLQDLGSYTIIDIGMIDNVTEEGRAHVTTNQYVGGKRVIYQDVEVVYPGNTGGVYQADCSGSACLIFIPYTCIPDIKQRKIRVTAQPYHKDGVKVMPIGNGRDCNVKQIIDTYGNLCVTSEVHKLLFTEDTITFQQDDILNITKALDGSLYFYYKDEDTGPLTLNINKDGVERVYESTDGSVVWRDQLTPDGTRTLAQEDGDGNAINTISISPDGVLTIENTKDVVINTGDGNLKMNGDSKHLVKFEDLKAAMDKLYLALTTTPIAGNGAPQPTWSGITSIDISASKADTLLTGD